jgi:hypothetical protein
VELKQELEYYLSIKDELLKHYKGQFVLIKDKKVIGTYTTWEEAFNSAIDKFGNVSFLIKPVQEKEEVIQFPALLVGAINANA